MSINFIRVSPENIKCIRTTRETTLSLFRVFITLKSLQTPTLFTRDLKDMENLFFING